jgi:hypothetical protein
MYVLQMPGVSSKSHKYTILSCLIMLSLFLHIFGPLIIVLGVSPSEIRVLIYYMHVKRNQFF